MANERGSGTPRVLKRIALARSGIFLAVILVVVLAFALHLGALSFLMRGIALLGVLAFAASYLWEWKARWRRRRE